MWGHPGACVRTCPGLVLSRLVLSIEERPASAVGRTGYCGYLGDYRPSARPGPPRSPQHAENALRVGTCLGIGSSPDERAGGPMGFVPDSDAWPVGGTQLLGERFRSTAHRSLVLYD